MDLQSPGFSSRSCFSYLRALNRIFETWQRAEELSLDFSVAPTMCERSAGAGTEWKMHSGLRQASDTGSSTSRVTTGN